MTTVKDKMFNATFALYYKKGSDYLKEHNKKFRTKNQLLAD